MNSNRRSALYKRTENAHLLIPIFKITKIITRVLNCRGILNKDSGLAMALNCTARRTRSQGRNTKVRTNQTKGINQYLNNNFQYIFIHTYMS